MTSYVPGSRDDRDGVCDPSRPCWLISGQAASAKIRCRCVVRVRSRGAFGFRQGRSPSRSGCSAAPCALREQPACRGTPVPRRIARSSARRPTKSPTWRIIPLSSTRDWVADCTYVPTWSGMVRSGGGGYVAGEQRRARPSNRVSSATAGRRRGAGRRQEREPPPVGSPQSPPRRSGRRARAGRQSRAPRRPPAVRRAGQVGRGASRSRPRRADSHPGSAAKSVARGTAGPRDRETACRVPRAAWRVARDGRRGPVLIPG
jgi:hypothetical protein